MWSKLQPNTLFVFDIETIPDDESAYNLISANLDSLQERREALKEYHLKITDGKNEFLRQPFHKVVAISFLTASIEYSNDGFESFHFKEIRSAKDENGSEYDLIKGFFATIDKLQPRIVSFNGRTFDLPVLKYRAMKYGISAKKFYSLGDKWENYNQRYALNMHCDLIDALSDFGASAKIKLNEVCAIFNYPGKIGVDGSLVSQMYDEGKIKEIRDYCETDVLNTYLVYLRYALHIGRINNNGYNKAIEDILVFLDKVKLPHFSEFQQAWDSITKKNYYL